MTLASPFDVCCVKATTSSARSLVRLATTALASIPRGNAAAWPRPFDPLFIAGYTCDNRTVTAPHPISRQHDLGKRIALAREERSLTQAELAGAIGVDRTAVAKLEAGARKVSATELVQIATTLNRPIDWFVFESPPAVVSRRLDPAVGGRSHDLDMRVERLGRDVAFLVDEGILSSISRSPFEVPADFQAAEQLAARARALLGAPDGPLYELQRACELVGLLGFSLDLGDLGGNAAYVDVSDLGVALVNGAIDAGRRRFNLAHELAHHLVGDAYAAETSTATSGDTERYLNAFAAYLLMPRASVMQVWEDIASRDRRLAAVAVAVRFRTSWTATCSHLCNLRTIDHDELEDLVKTPPKKGDFFELGEWWVPELEAPSVPPEYGRRVVRAYRSGKLTAARTVELLWDTVAFNDLPERDEIPLDGLRNEFDTISSATSSLTARSSVTLRAQVSSAHSSTWRLDTAAWRRPRC